MLKTGNVNDPSNGSDMPKNIVITAPTEAPEDTPNVYGSASGLRKRPWKAAPAIARDAPTSPDNNTRGKRIFHTILACMGSTVPSDIPGTIFESTIWMILEKGTETVPIDVPNKIVNTASAVIIT